MANTDCDNYYRCDNCNYCHYCNHCDYCKNCHYCSYCDNCDRCGNSYGCSNCYGCNYCYYCSYSVDLRMSEKMIFCIGEGRHERGIGYQKNHHAFNKQVTKKRFYEIDTEVKEILKNLKLNPNVLSKSWEDEWKKVTNAEWSKLSEIPEFDLDVVERIVGFRPCIDNS